MRKDNTGWKKWKSILYRRKIFGKLPPVITQTDYMLTEPVSSGEVVGKSINAWHFFLLLLARYSRTNRKQPYAKIG